MKMILLACVSLTVLCASAMVNYVVPWYANPVATNVTYDASLVNDQTDAAIAVKITTAWAAVSNAEALSGKTALVKTMGDTAYFRPKFYVLCTDGDFNVGVSSEAGLKDLISKKRDTGIFFSFARSLIAYPISLNQPRSDA